MLMINLPLGYDDNGKPVMGGVPDNKSLVLIYYSNPIELQSLIYTLTMLLDVRDSEESVLLYTNPTRQLFYRSHGFHNISYDPIDYKLMLKGMEHLSESLRFMPLDDLPDTSIVADDFPYFKENMSDLAVDSLITLSRSTSGKCSVIIATDNPEDFTPEMRNSAGMTIFLGLPSRQLLLEYKDQLNVQGGVPSYFALQSGKVIPFAKPREVE